MLIKTYANSNNQVLKMVCIGNIGIFPYGNAHAKPLKSLMHLGLIFAKTQWLMIKNDIMIYNFNSQDNSQDPF